MSKTITQLTAGTPPTGEEHVEVTQGVNSRRLRSGQFAGLFRVRVATSSNVNISTGLEAGDTIDGVALAAGDAVLLTGQSTTHQNGVYVAAASGAASRHAAFAAYNDLAGMVFSVMEGTVYADTLWVCTSNKGGTIGSTAVAVTLFSGGGTWTPTVSFRTPGNLSVTYYQQDGAYLFLPDRHVKLIFALEFTPTYTTAASNFEIAGFGSVPGVAAFGAVGIVNWQLGSGSAVLPSAWPTGGTMLALIYNTTFNVLRVNAPGVGVNSAFTVTEITSGVRRALRGEMTYKLA